MIPKKLHYCWFGHGPKPKLAEKCIANWKKYCPDWEIIEWNESNFDVTQNGYTRMCIAERKYAFLSDYVRLRVVAEHGGVYLDTDVELIKPLDNLLVHDAFFGFETPEYVNSGLGFGSVAHGIAIEAMLSEYDVLLDGLHGTIGCPQLNTNALSKLGLNKNGTIQVVADAVIYPADAFNPYDDPTGRLNITPSTFSIHWYAKSALSKKAIIRSKLTRPLHRIFGVDFFRKFRK